MVIKFRRQKIFFSLHPLTFSNWGPVNWRDSRQVDKNEQKPEMMFYIPLTHTSSLSWVTESILEAGSTQLNFQGGEEEKALVENKWVFGKTDGPLGDRMGLLAGSFSLRGKSCSWKRICVSWAPLGSFDVGPIRDFRHSSAFRLK